MNKIWLTISFLFAISGISQGQTVIEKTFYKDQYKVQKVLNEKQAKYVETKFQLDDKTYSIEFNKIKGAKLISYKCYKKNRPFGVWKNYNKNKKEYDELDYSFELKYSNEIFEDKIYFDIQSGEVITEEIEKEAFTIPKLKGYPSPLIPIYKQIRYPEIPRTEGIMGEVKVHIKIDEKGELTVLGIYEGVEAHLDAETVRVLNLNKDWEPAKFNGNAIESFSIVKIKYKLE